MAKFYICPRCKNIVEMVEDKGVPLFCCGMKMEEIVADSQDGAVEKHVPVVTVDQNIVTVNVGDVEHPMTEEHTIDWIQLETQTYTYRRNLTASNHPRASFVLPRGETVKRVVAYCNLHGLYESK